MSKHWKPPVRVLFQGNARAGGYKSTPGRKAGARHARKQATGEPTHALFHDTSKGSMFEGTMQECYDNLTRRRPGESFDWLLLNGWTIKRIDEPKAVTQPEPMPKPKSDAVLLVCLKCYGKGCADCHRGLVERRLPEKACCEPSEGVSDDHGHESGLLGPAGGRG